MYRSSLPTSAVYCFLAFAFLIGPGALVRAQDLSRNPEVNDTAEKALVEKLLRVTTSSDSGPKVGHVGVDAGYSVYVPEENGAWTRSLYHDGRMKLDGHEVQLEPVFGGPANAGRDAALDYKFLKAGDYRVLIQYLEKRSSSSERERAENVILKINRGKNTTVIQAVAYGGC